ncbi:GNAT family N-acetyltransferase [Planomicrobium sp. CPCC 101110]|uniref:GNAT family N-acetyltransferase n=1 Tax=Planomicrobium sp. CPCC 101110 TaxID=2599619 RepID=UPI0011B823A6|nr:GNAT family N-acetyltransferase [Planomicrobium sp. CPCC 101110]TWT25761.1 GNAT family N-acetyltransferase [Planomicrobium sp. CPCC 101110]
MLIKYKKSYEKIAMGLLSFMPKERTLKNLLQTMKQYNLAPDWQFYLWKYQEDIIGLIGVEVKEDFVTVQHASVNPSHRGEGVGRTMVEEIHRLMPHHKMRATKETESFLLKCYK